MQSVGSDPTYLVYAIRFRAVFKYISQLCLILAILLLAPLAVSLFWAEYWMTLRYCLVALFLGGIGFLGHFQSPPEQLQANEVYFVIAFTYLLLSFVMAYPMMGAGLNFMDAWFESVSAVTTTGLTTVDSVENKAQTFLFSRAWIQWIGGLGIAILSLGLAMQPSSVARKFSLSLLDSKEIVGSTRSYARKLLIVYSCLTLLCIFTLWIFGAPLYQGFLIALGSVSTGGFSPYDNSLANFSWPLQTTVTFFSFLGALSLPLFWMLRLNALKKLSADFQAMTLILCGLVTSIALYGFFYFEPSALSEKIQNAFFNAFSAQTTTGFSTVKIASLDGSAKLAMIASMLIGGCTHSTAGGLKIIRFLILIKGIQVLFFRTALSKSAVYTPKLGKIPLTTEERELCFSIFSLFLIATFFSWFLFVASGYNPLDSLFEVISALGTVGLSTGISNSHLPGYLKTVLCFDMFLGRLEMITFLILFYPKTLAGRRTHF